MNLINYNQINKAILHSKEIYNQSKGVLVSKMASLNDYICIYLVGSYGRYEADPEVSDLEWLLVYDDKRVSVHEANIFQANLTEAFANIVGRERLSIAKTFGEQIPISELISNVGGVADSTRMLTYRMLCLAEGTPLLKNKTYIQIIKNLATVYGGSHTAGHRLLSFATDIARYWRTLRIDYKQKVDEQKKPWAIRGMKLRGCRRYWYFSMALFFIAFGPRLKDTDGYDEFDLDVVYKFMASQSMNPTERIISAANKLDADLDLVKKTLTIYNRYLEIISSEDTRAELDILPFEKRYTSEKYTVLKNACIELHGLMVDIIISLPEYPRKQLIEMFLL